MRAIRHVAFGSLLAALPVLAGAAPEGVDVAVYGSMADSVGGQDYVRLYQGVAVIAPLPHALVAGAFPNDSNAFEYAIDDTGNAVSVDTSNGAVTTIGPFVEPIAHVALATFPNAVPSTSALGIASDADCTFTTLFTTDLASNAVTVLGPLSGCLQSLAIVPPQTIYTIDRDHGAIAVITGDVIDLGSPGVPIDDHSALAVAPDSGELLLFGFAGGSNVVYIVDTATGAATLIGSVGGAAPLSALALAPAPTDAIFANGFDG